MKKVITVLAILVVLMGAAFAATNDELIITATIPATSPVFSIYGGTSSDAITTLGTQAGATINTNVDISSADVKIYLKITQAKSRYSGAVTLTITPTALANTTEGLTSYATALPTAAGYVEGKGSVNGITIANPTASNSVVTYSLIYSGHPVSANSVIGTFNYTWTHNDNLPVGDYRATITLGYTVE